MMTTGWRSGLLCGMTAVLKPAATPSERRGYWNATSAKLRSFRLCS